MYKKKMMTLVNSLEKECKQAVLKEVKDKVPAFIYSNLCGTVFSEIICDEKVSQRQVINVLAVLYQKGGENFKSKFNVFAEQIDCISYPRDTIAFGVLDKNNFFMFQDIAKKDDKRIFSVRFFGKNHKKWCKKIDYMANHVFDCRCDKKKGIKEKDLYVFSSNEKGNIIRYTKRGRGLDRIVLPEQKKKDLKNFLDKWRQDQEYYREIEEDFKTGLIFYGDPGTGKSSISKSVYDYLDASTFYIVNSSRIEEDIENLTRLREERTGIFVIVFEDFDTFFTNSNREKTELSKRDSDNMNLLLQFLDGAKSLTEVVYIATTNHLEKLDKALIRAGRFDFSLELTDLDKDRAGVFCLNMGYDPSIMEEMSITFPIRPVELRKKILERRQNQRVADPLFIGEKK